MDVRKYGSPSRKGKRLGNKLEKPLQWRKLLFTAAIKMQGMVIDFNSKNVLQGRFDVLNSRIAEFQHFIAVGKDDVIVLLVLKCPFEQRGCLTKLMFAHQITVDQQIDGIVKRSPGNAVLLVFHPEVKRFDIEMPFVFIDFSKNGETLRRFAMLVKFQISGKYVADFVLYQC